MGKRELLLIGLFVILGVGVWRLTAPPSPEGEGFSITRAWDQLRSSMRGEHVASDTRRVATVAPPAGARAVAVEGFTGDLWVSGEDRADVSAELSGSIFGGDQAEAESRAKEVALVLEPGEERVFVRVQVPTTRQHRARLELRLKVPAKLGLVVRDTRGRVEIRGLASVDVESRLGDLTVADVTGLVKGQHRGSNVELSRVGSVEFESRMGDVRVVHVAGAVTLTAEGGNTELRDVAGNVRLKTRRTDLDLDRLAGEVTINAADGEVELRHPRAVVTFEGERSRFTATLDTAVPMSVTTEDAPVELVVPAGGHVSLDLGAEDGRVIVPEGLPAVTTTDRHESLTTSAGPKAPTIKVRTVRENVTIRR
jgi:hypothetical protein